MRQVYQRLGRSLEATKALQRFSEGPRELARLGRLGDDHRYAVPVFVNALLVNVQPPKHQRKVCRYRRRARQLPLSPGLFLENRGTRAGTQGSR